MANADRNAGVSIWKLEGQQLREAEAIGRQTLARQPVDTHALNVLARAHFDRGDDIEAIRLLKHALYSNPRQHISYDSLVKIYRRLKQYENASTVYDEWASDIATGDQEIDSICPWLPDDSNAVDHIANYYAVRASEYDATCGYMNSQRLDARKMRYQDELKGCDVIEIACGTGFWTEIISTAARSVLATDRNAEQVSIVQRKFAANANIRCQLADAYRLDNISGPFSAAFSHFWWSHIPKSKLSLFLSTLHSKLAAGARVILADSLPYLDRPRRLDEEGNVLEQRFLKNGDRYEVIKNFPIESEIRSALNGFADEIAYDQDVDDGIWTVTYRAVTAG